MPHCGFSSVASQCVSSLEQIGDDFRVLCGDIGRLALVGGEVVQRRRESGSGEIAQLPVALADGPNVIGPPE